MVFINLKNVFIDFQIRALRSELVDHVHQHDALQGGHAGPEVGGDLQRPRDLHVQRTKAVAICLGKKLSKNDLSF